jgi:hypothetical protein
MYRKISYVVTLILVITVVLSGCTKKQDTLIIEVPIDEYLQNALDRDAADNTENESPDPADTWPTVHFGTYEGEPIEWYVLTKKDGATLLFSTQSMGDREYYSDEKHAALADFASPSWADSDLREWLNGEFYNAAFSGKEKSVITETENLTYAFEYSWTPEGEPVVNEPDGPATTDKVFVFSAGEKALLFQEPYGDNTTLKETHSLYADIGTLPPDLADTNDSYVPYWERNYIYQAGQNQTRAVRAVIWVDSSVIN